MESNYLHAVRIVNKLNPKITLAEQAEAVSWVKAQITYAMDDAFKLVKNINDTSSNESDRQKRIIDMESEFGIPKTHII